MKKVHCFLEDDPNRIRKLTHHPTLQTIFHLEETSISKEVLPFLNTHVEEF